MFIIQATFTSPYRPEPSFLFLVPSLLGQGMAWGDRSQAVKFPTQQAAAAAYKANKPSSMFRAGRVFDVVPA